MPAAFFNRFNDFRRSGLIYPSPFFDIAQTYMPPTVKELFKWCKYYFYTHPIINPAVYKMSEYPITEIIYQDIKKVDTEQVTEQDEPDEAVRDSYREILEDILDIKTFLINCGLDYFTYGNSFISLRHPFIRMLACSSCNKSFDIRNLKEEQWSYQNFKFFLTCPACGSKGTAKCTDTSVRDRSELTLIRWNPENINIKFNQLTGRSTYTYTIPEAIRKAIRTGQHDSIVDTPMEFLSAVEKNQDLKFNKENFFHLKRCTLAEQDQGWGKPLILPAMRDAFYLQILRKANEAISLQYIVPLTVLFPQHHGNIDPYKHMNLGKWRDRVEQEIAAWKDDPNYIPIMPIPIGNQQVFGNGKALMVTPEIRAISEQMVTGMGVPTEFIFGGLSYSGSSVSLRIVENHLLRYREGMLRLLKFLVDKVQKFTKLAKINVKFREFKMADDVQQQQLVMGLIQNRQISLVTGLQLLGFQFKNEEDKLKKESVFVNEMAKDQMIAQAEAQGEGSVIMAKYQAEAERVLMEAQLINQNKLLQETPQAAQYLMAGPGGEAMAAAPGAATEGQTPQQGMTDQVAPTQQQQQYADQQDPQVQAGYGPGEMDERPIDPRLLALHIAAQINGMQSPVKKKQVLSALSTDYPQLNSVVMDVMKRQKDYQTEPNMPTVLPPRRQGGSSL